MGFRSASLLLLLCLAGCNSQAPTSAPIRSPAGDNGRPPAGVHLFYVGVAAHPSWYTGFDWSGNPRATIKFAEGPRPEESLVQAPDGSAFLIQPTKGDGGRFLDRLGRRVASEVPGLAAWADDSSRLCTLDYAPGRWWIGAMTPGGVAGTDQRVTFFTPFVPPGLVGTQITACSPRDNVAVLTYAVAGDPPYVWSVRLSDGVNLSNETFDRNSLSGIVASLDGKLFAENSNASTGYLQPGAEAHTSIRRFANGSVVARLDPTIGVLAFSADDSVALVNTSPWASGVATHLALVKVDTGAVLWRYDGVEEFAASLSEPGGSSLAVMLQNPGDQSAHPAVVIVIVHGDGSSTRLAGTYVRP